MPNFISDYLLYNSGNECPTNYHRWVALSILASTVTRKVMVNQGYFRIRPNLYIGLIGSQGGRKTTAMDIGREIFLKAFPEHPVGNSTQSAEDIIRTMASDDCLRCYTDENGVSIDYKPYSLFVNELKNFLAVNPARMIALLTDIYDREVFDSGTIKRGLEKIERPCLNFICCEVPDWIIDNLKSSVISGGFARRIIYVFENSEVRRITFPYISPEMEKARERCIAHLQRISPIAGKFTWDRDAMAFFDEWYQTRKRYEDPIMEGYGSSKHVQLQKIAMLLAMAEETPELIITRPNLELGLAMLDEVEVNMPRLSLAAGRNELAVPQQRFLEMIEASGGIIADKEARRRGTKDMSPYELDMTINHLRNTEQIFAYTFRFPDDKGPARVWLLLPGALLREDVKEAMRKQGLNR